jgi:hypothetical protein
MISRGAFSTRRKFIFAATLLLCPLLAIAQERSGQAGPGVPAGRPYGVDERDSLKDFHQAMAVQATSGQIAEFQALVKSAEEAKAKIQILEQQRNQTAPASASTVSGSQLDQAIENVRAQSKKFVDGFSATQKSGMKDLVRRLGKADSDLEAEEKKLDQNLQAANRSGPETPARVESLDKALADFSNLQLELGREMGIILATGNAASFTFAPVKSMANIGNKTTAVTVSGTLSQTAAEGGQRTFKLEMIADLLDLQQNITELLRPQIEKPVPCGERFALRQASIVPATPSSILFLRLHYERWGCRGSMGQSLSTELAEGEGSVEIKLTPAVEKSNSVKLAAEFSRIDASGMMGDSLRSGDLGDELRDEVSQSILTAMRPGTDFKTILPPAVQNSAVVQTVKFQDAIAGQLTVVLDGQMEVSNDQFNLMGTQLNQAMSAQGTASR